MMQACTSGDRPPWMARGGPDAPLRPLSQGLPFSVAGVGDLLALFRCVSVQYRFSTDVSKPTLMGAIDRVYVTGEVGGGQTRVLWLGAGRRDGGAALTASTPAREPGAAEGTAGREWPSWASRSARRPPDPAPALWGVTPVKKHHPHSHRVWAGPPGRPRMKSTWLHRRCYVRFLGLPGGAAQK
jgi:hypothetical protein